jgi:hypothetical protein
MRRQYARGAGCRAQARLADGGEHRAQRGGRAGDRRGTEGGDAEAGQPGRHARNCAALVEHVGAFDAVHVHVDEPRDDRVVPQIEMEIAWRSRRRIGSHVDDAIAVDDDRRGSEDAIRQDDVGVGEKDHAAYTVVSICQSSLRPSSGSGTAPAARNSFWSACSSSLRSQRSSGALNTITPGLSLAGNRRSSV